jgi:hypothetical protein
MDSILEAKDGSGSKKCSDTARGRTGRKDGLDSESGKPHPIWAFKGKAV